MALTRAFRPLLLILFVIATLTFWYIFYCFSPHDQSTASNYMPNFQEMLSPKAKLEHASDQYPEFAIALKTGRDVVAERCAIQTNTFLGNAKNVILIAESSEVSLGDIPVYDVYTDTLKNSTHKQLKKRAKDAVTVDESSLGWQLDAHKNIPGMRLLYEKYPHAEWYIMLDDDTYMFFDNLRRRIKSQKLDPTQPHYLGASSVFTGCDGITSFDDSPGFAHGGSGIVVSKGALEKMLKVIDNCIDRYRDCWGGDIRLALCMRDAGVLLTPESDFNSNPPNVEFPFHDRNPCTQPITFHHLLPQQIQLLYETERKMQGNVTYADVVDRFKHLNHNTVNKLERDGDGYTKISVTDMKKCRSLCENDTRCISWSFVDSVCHLRDSQTQLTRVENEKSFSNIYPMHYTCSHSQ
ncbi:hypothetical protein K7432_011892 [Basidiobolus ranarum]|uniref:Apple domain-containing protein n=1 Tax=Basidiobolus ranarum TaxID=34480 RepID=A0ABR2VT52_9FUNG